MVEVVSRSDIVAGNLRLPRNQNFLILRSQASPKRAGELFVVMNMKVSQL